MSYDFECVIMTSGVRGTPHMASLNNSNPELIVHTCVSPEVGYKGWYNCDRHIREWSRRELTASKYLFLEYDVLIDASIKNYFDNNDVEAMGYTDCDFPCIAEGSKLKAYDIKACRISPLAVVMLSRQVLSAIVQPEMNSVFEDEIYCEVRFPSVIQHLGYSIAVNGKLNKEHGVCHPVK